MNFIMFLRMLEMVLDTGVPLEKANILKVFHTGVVARSLKGKIESICINSKYREEYENIER